MLFKCRQCRRLPLLPYVMVVNWCPVGGGVKCPGKCPDPHCLQSATLSNKARLLSKASVYLGLAAASSYTFVSSQSVFTVLGHINGCCRKYTGGMGVTTGRWKRPDRNGYDNGRIHQKRTTRATQQSCKQAVILPVRDADTCKCVAELTALTCYLLVSPDHRLTSDICQRPGDTDHSQRLWRTNNARYTRRLGLYITWQMVINDGDGRAL